MSSMDQFVQLVQSTTTPKEIVTFVGKVSKDSRESFLCSPLANNVDPLGALDPANHTLGYLYILSARLNANISTNYNQIVTFSSLATPEQLKSAPERVALLARALNRWADGHRSPALAVPPLRNLMDRFAIAGSLSAVHAPFVQACLSSNHLAVALPYLSTPITDVDTHANPDLQYTDALVYHYTAGIILGAVKRWAEAEEYLEVAVTIPAQVTGAGPAVSAIQLEAFKKLALIQLISTGKTTAPPRYASPALLRMLKNSHYGPLLDMNQSKQKMEAARSIAEKERSYFISERNMGLIYQAFNRAPRWAIKKLTATYLTLSLSEIGRAVGIENQEEIEANEVTAQIDGSDTVTFSDPPQEFTKADVDKMLRSAQEQDAMLKRLEMEMSRSREYLTKAVKTKDESWGPGGVHDDDFVGVQSQGVDDFDAMYA